MPQDRIIAVLSASQGDILEVRRGFGERRWAGDAAGPFSGPGFAGVDTRSTRKAHNALANVLTTSANLLCTLPPSSPLSYLLTSHAFHLLNYLITSHAFHLLTYVLTYFTRFPLACLLTYFTRSPLHPPGRDRHRRHQRLQGALQRRVRQAGGGGADGREDRRRTRGWVGGRVGGVGWVGGWRSALLSGQGVCPHTACVWRGAAGRDLGAGRRLRGAIRPRVPAESPHSSRAAPSPCSLRARRAPGGGSPLCHLRAGGRGADVPLGPGLAPGLVRRRVGWCACACVWEGGGGQRGGEKPGRLFAKGAHLCLCTCVPLADPNV